MIERMNDSEVEMGALTCVMRLVSYSDVASPWGANASARLKLKGQLHWFVKKAESCGYRRRERETGELNH